MSSSSAYAIRRGGLRQDFDKRRGAMAAIGNLPVAARRLLASNEARVGARWRHCASLCKMRLNPAPQRRPERASDDSPQRSALVRETQLPRWASVLVYVAAGLVAHWIIRLFTGSGR